jgi:hypothetical protein
MRDLASLQIQARALEGFKESRRLMLTQKVAFFYFVCIVFIFSIQPSARLNWVSFALSAHLLGDFPLALKFFTLFTWKIFFFVDFFFFLCSILNEFKKTLDDERAREREKKRLKLLEKK